MAEVSERFLKKLERVLDNLENKDEWISEEEACVFLGISKRSLQNKVYDKSVPRSAWAKTVTGGRVYNKTKLRAERPTI